MKIIRLWLLGLTVFALTACQPTRMENPIGVMLDRETSYTERRIAMRQADEYESENPAYIAALEKIVWTYGFPIWQRIDAIDRLIAIDEEAFRRSLDQRILDVPDLQTLYYIFDVALKRQWDNFTPVVVRSYARKLPYVDDSIRKERDVLVALNPGKTPEQVILDMFLDDATGEVQNQQLDAWELLCRLSDDRKLRELLEETPHHGIVEDIRAGMDDLGVLPRNRESVLWVQALRKPDNENYWKTASQKLAELNDTHLLGMQLRHLRLLPLMDENMLAQTRGALIAETAVRLGQNEHHYKTPDQARTQTIAANMDKLAWADLIAINLLMDALKDRDVVNRLFTHADADLNDKDSEYGCVIDYDEKAQRFVVRTYKPLLKKRDDVFLPPQIMIDDAYTSLFHGHFHAQYYKNAEYAGPGDGDLAQAKNLQFNHVVFTFIDENSLNVDYYQPNGVIIDIGTIHR